MLHRTAHRRGARPDHPRGGEQIDQGLHGEASRGGGLHAHRAHGGCADHRHPHRHRSADLPGRPYAGPEQGGAVLRSERSLRSKDRVHGRGLLGHVSQHGDRTDRQRARPPVRGRGIRGRELRQRCHQWLGNDGFRDRRRAAARLPWPSPIPRGTTLPRRAAGRPNRDTATPEGAASGPPLRVTVRIGSGATIERYTAGQVARSPASRPTRALDLLVGPKTLAVGPPEIDLWPRLGGSQVALRGTYYGPQPPLSGDTAAESGRGHSFRASSPAGRCSVPGVRGGQVFGRFARGLSRRLHGEEDGLTLVETLVAVTVMLFTVLSLAYTGVVAFADIALARQRQDATALADRTMELVRALPFDRIKTGLQKADLDATSDPNIVKPCGGVAGTFCFRGEHIPSGTVGTLAPLAPHQSVHTVGPTTYTVSTYVTYYQDDQTTTPPTFRVVVIVSWNLTVRRGASNSVEVQSILTSPTGCLSTATHPFAAPCQPFFYADAVQDQGSIRITGSIDGVSLDHASLLGTADGSNMQIEQISAVQGRATTSGVDLQLTGQDPQSEGDLAVSSGADNDPSQPSADFQDSLLAPPQVGGTLTASDPSGSNSIDVTATSGDNARSISTTSSTTTNQCPPSPGTPQTDQLPCGSSTGEQGSAAPMTASTTLNGVSADLGPATLASLGPSGTGSAFTDRDIPSGSDGTVHADVSRSTGTLSRADLPAKAPRRVPRPSRKRGR